MKPIPTPLDRIIAIVERLRDPVDGCDWDRVQTFATIAPYTIEEAYEVADAIARDDMAALKDELGDLLFQVVLHSRIAEQLGAFSLGDVAAAIADKMERRHPHLFGDAEARPDWETLKAAERSDAASALDGVALALPALMRAEKLQKRAARTGFDWPDASGPRAKIDEELVEIEAASTPAEHEDEVGDLLFAVVNYARHLGVDPEVALRGANAKFEGRFRSIETVPGFAGMSLDEKERLWVAVKKK
ncbi:nucleoside triphosphate pyrophosphohydrolase [Sphingomonas sp. SUN039]|uniref:nucleoside triphosphate pyrophosphohydrolase n=1 Tax=Sphingomonas sp. SUN039 TaxID=2937787 RepID=UPI0021647882|nr:nucleoside triphosphate pyrophosphohydrolase [Sphingomonas sp. SUN039]UVO53506.1 nucleoside triphosphate pyrophosphohydrolase [Sphingomonas sp. SUN039]